MRSRLREMRESDSSGFTLVELLVGSALMLGLLGMASTTIIGVSQGAKQTRIQHDLNEEGRVALNRMGRELRQATRLVYAYNPDGPGYNPGRVVALSFRANFNGDNCTGNACATTNVTTNPESLTYCFNPADPDPVRRTNLWLIPTELDASFAGTTCQIPGALPILAGSVAGFKLEYRSNNYRFDTEAPAGVTTWRELDAAPPPVGDAGVPDGNINTAAINGVNSVVITLQMRKDNHSQDYTTQVDLRNKP